MANGESGTAPKQTESKPSRSRTWELVSLLAPALLAAYLTFLSGRSESRIKQGIESQSAVLSAQLRLNEELYRRRIDTYEKLYVQLKTLETKLQDRTAASGADMAK